MCRYIPWTYWRGFSLLRHLGSFSLFDVSAYQGLGFLVMAIRMVAEAEEGGVVGVQAVVPIMAWER